MNKREIAELLREQIDLCGSNNFAMIGHSDEQMWEKPLVGFASGSDPLFQFLKEDIGEFYMTPLEVFRTRYGGTDAGGKDLTVISFAFSQTAETKRLQALQNEGPCMRWMLSRNTWKTVSGEFYTRVSDLLAGQGVDFVIPDLMPEMKVIKSEKYGESAVWSQRHTAFACGLGTFGLSDGLITARGVAMRFASVVVGQVFEPDKREYEKHQEWCLFYNSGSCGDCIKRCPAGAISGEGHDKEKCSNYLDRMDQKHGQNPLIDPLIEVGCGLCQSAVPCADGKPEK